jgi:hypothetical protein
MLTQTDTETLGVYTLTDFLTEIGGPARRDDNASTLRDWLTNTDHGWMGTRDDKRGEETASDTTKRLVRDGWARGLKLMEKVAGKVTAPTPKAVRRVQRWGRQGDDIDMQRVWHGDIDTAWRETQRDMRSGPRRVRVLVDSIASGYVDADEMRWRGVAALKLTDMLTEAGYSVQVESVMCTPCDGHTYKVRTIVKDYTQPTDLLTLAATTALPAFFRSLVHTWGVVVANRKRHGVSFSVQKAIASDFPDATDGAPAFMLGQDIDCADKASEAITKIINALDEAGE